MLVGAPIGVGARHGRHRRVSIANADLSGSMALAMPQNFYAGLAKYPLLAFRCSCWPA